MIVTRKPHRLAAKWSAKDRDLYVDCSPRFGSGALRLVCDALSPDFLAELERRGFDLRTLRFQVDKTPEAIAQHERDAGRA